MRTRDVVHIGMYVALFTVLELLSNAVPLFRMPQGGSLSLGSIALLMASYHLGWKLGIITTVVAFGVMMVLPGDVIHFLNVLQFLCDYLFAYGAYALAIIFKDLTIGNISMPIGVVVTNFIRFMFHNIAGWAFFSEFYPGKVLWGVMGYNASYMIPTTIVSFLVILVMKERLLSKIGLKGF